MAKAKEARATPKAKDAPSKKAKSSKLAKTGFNLSEDKVVDSDSENDASPAKSPAKSKSKTVEKSKPSDPKPKEGSTSKKAAKLNGVKRKAEDKKDEDGGKDEVQRPVKKAKKTEVDVEESSSSEEEDSSSEEEAEKLAAPKGKAETVKTPKKAEPVSDVDMKDSSSEEESDESSDDESTENATASVAKKAEQKSKKAQVPEVDMKDSTSDDDEEDESSESSEEEESSVQTSKDKAKAKDETSKLESQAKASDSSEEEDEDESGEDATGESSKASIPVKPFEPPSGYATLKLSDLSSTSPFFKGNLSGKQIWHIAAPSSVPLTSITEVALDAVQNGTPVLNHKGVDYVLAEDKNHATMFDTVFLPTQKGYQSVGQKVATTLHLQQKIVLPNLTKTQADVNTGSSAAADIARASVSEARPQPKGLRMRYKPPGFGRGKPGRVGADSDSSDEDNAQQRTTGKALQFPKALGAHGPSDKPDSDEHLATEKVKKSKKKSHKVENTAEADDAAEAEDPTETKEERAKRKELKRLKKEAKKKAKESQG